jgi:hypothetical protein
LNVAFGIRFDSVAGKWEAARIQPSQVDFNIRNPAATLQITLRDAQVRRIS